MDEHLEARAGEAELIERFRRGDSEVFDEIVRAHRHVVYAVARRILARPEDADEAAQETFVRAWRGLDRFHGESALRTWLIRIALNVSRSLEARRRDPVAAAEIARDPEPEDEHPRADETLEQRDLASRVRSAVDALPRRQREVVLLRVFEGLSGAEVAAVMGITEGAVKAHLHQAVSNLKRLMAPASVGRLR